jgi:transcriptional regulator of heat shock response
MQVKILPAYSKEEIMNKDIESVLKFVESHAEGTTCSIIIRYEILRLEQENAKLKERIDELQKQITGLLNLPPVV